MALAVPALSLIPTWHGYQSAPPDQVFMGFRYMVGDHFAYAAFMRQAHDNPRILMENSFTSEPQRPSYLLVYFWTLGIASRLTGASIPFIWEVFRVVGGFLYIVLFWHWTAYYAREGPRRILLTALFAFAGGINWIVTLLRVTLVPSAKVLEYPYNMFWNWSTFGTMALPNWVWPALAMIAVFLMLMKKTAWRDAVTFILLPLVWFLHPYSGMVAYLAIGLVPFMPLLVSAARLESVDRARVWANLRLALPGLLSFLVVGGFLLWARSDAVFRLSSENGFSWTPHFSVWWYVLSYGALLPLAWFGARDLSREKDLRADIVFSWLLAAFFLSVNPLFAGVKFQFLLFPPLVMLAGRGLFHLWERSEALQRVARTKPAIACLALLLFLNAPVSLVKGMPVARTDPDIFMQSAELAAMKWLEKQPDGLVLSGYWAGNRIPYLAGKKVYIGHWFMTLDISEKNRELAYLLSPQVPQPTKDQILRKSAARYVYVGRAEASMGRIDPALPLSKIYDKAGVAIYEYQHAR
jgi:hypothetical protein